MPSSAVRTFTDPDDYAASIRRATVELTVTGRGDFNAKLARIDLHRLWMQRFSDNLPRILDIADAVPGRAYIFFSARPGPHLIQAGVQFHPYSVLRHGQADQLYQRSSGLTSLGTMSLPIEDIATVGEAMAGLDLTPPPDVMLVTPTPAALAKLQRLHAVAGHLAENAPEIIANLNAARGLEQGLIEVLIDCLASHDDRESGLAERTLRLCCQEHLGMGPKRYLLLRRMHLARRALRRAAPDTNSVTEIATRFGFWQLGRFSVEYQSLFGESPSATLRGAPK